MKGSVHLQASRCLTEQHQATCNEELDYKDWRWKWEEGDMRWRPRNISLARELNKGRLLHHFSPPQRSQTLASSALNYISWIISPSWFGHADVTFENRWTLATICFSFLFFSLVMTLQWARREPMDVSHEGYRANPLPFRRAEILLLGALLGNSFSCFSLGYVRAKWWFIILFLEQPYLEI